MRRLTYRAQKAGVAVLDHGGHEGELFVGE